VAETILLIGTRKGLVLARSRDDRRSWSVEPLRFDTLEVYSVGVDPRRDPPRLFAGVGSQHWGPIFAYSDDLGRTWSEPEQPPMAFPPDSGASLMRVWQIVAAPDNQPDVVYTGVEPHAVFRSEDGGVSFQLVEGLFNHPHRSEWRPGFGGACLHTVIPHPTDAQQMTIAMSTGGVYRTTDGGASWAPANRGIPVAWAPDNVQYPEFGQCVHRVAMHAQRPERLYAQNHGGVFRSDDSGGSWQPIESGLPTTFGFPIAVHPHQPDTVYVFPLSRDAARTPPDGRCRVYRSEDGGGSWQPLTDGLPQETYYSAVLRDAMCTDSHDSAGIYFGTRVGEVYASRDGGDHWSLVAQHLPDVMSVRVATVA
jgi:hypothetical protein